MTITFNNGYLELAYLDSPYMGGEQGIGTAFQASMLINEAIPYGLQSEMQILGSDVKLGMQIEQVVKAAIKLGMSAFMLNNSDVAIGSQAESFIAEGVFDGVQALMHVDSVAATGLQSSQHINNEPWSLGMQIESLIAEGVFEGFQTLMHVDSVTAMGLQSSQHINDEPWPIGIQVDSRISNFTELGMQAKQFPLAHFLCGDVYLTRPYLSQSYLAYCMRATQGMQALQEVIKPKATGLQALQIIKEAWSLGAQVEGRIFKEKNIGMQTKQRIFEFNDTSMQAQQKIEEVLSIGMQAEGRIFTTDNLGFQTLMVRAIKQSAQVTMVIYNVTQLRILTDFASRGTPALGGNNWTSLQALKAGDFGANNLNTDIVEQRCQTDGTPAIWQLRCDTGIPQGAFVDTAAILSHNLTKSARVTLQGSNDPLWSSAGFSVVMVTELENMYYIAPILPVDSYRYWRLLIEDSTNANELSIGTIVFGSSRMMTVRECFQNPVTFGQRHYKDTIETEGFTNVSNDRATRKYLSLNFADLKIDSGNYKMFVEYMKLVKTDLKALIIPRPTRPSALAIFAKLTQLPEETHNAISDIEHYISFTFSWDEGL